MADLPQIILPARIAGRARTATPAAAVPQGQILTKDVGSPTNRPVAQHRTLRSSPALMRALAEENGLASTAFLNLAALADSGWFMVAFGTWTQEFSFEGLKVAETIVSALDTNWDYSKGYNDRKSMGSLIETALWEVVQAAGIGLELVLDSYRVPRNIVLFPYDQVEWVSAGNGRKYPRQVPERGAPIDLNYPTIFVGESVKSADRKYALPFGVSGAQRLFQYESFIEDMWRVLQRVGEPRVVATLDLEKVAAAAPEEARADSNSMRAYLESTRADVENVLSGLNPEDALVVYNTVEVDSISAVGEKRDYKELLQELSGQAASAVKSNPSMLGMRLGGSQNVASVESMLSTKMARRLQVPIEEVFSRALTLAVRLYGVDAYIKMRFMPINLRPEEELAAHRSMDQARVLELLSLGRITDDEAQVLLRLTSLPESAPRLSGTRFYRARPPESQPASGTNSLNASITPPGPAAAGGEDNASRA